MLADLNSSLRALLLAIVCVALLLIACGKKEATPQGTDQTKQQGTASGPTSSTATNALVLPLHFEHHTGDLDEMVKSVRLSFLIPSASFMTRDGPEAPS